MADRTCEWLADTGRLVLRPALVLQSATAAMRAESASRIIRDARILGGAPIIRGTRVPVRAIAFLWRATGDRSLVSRDYPFLADEDVNEAICYYETHRTEIDADLLNEQDEGD